MTEIRCPNGHLSSESDYCDVCGARIEPTAQSGAQPEAPSASPSVEETAHPPGSVPCPRCGTFNTQSDKFCEGCGLNFANPAPAPASTPAPAVLPRTDTDWVAIVTADHEYY
jgi:hypothetical protein